jgi:methyl-accepting chemotaxis protein
MSANKALRRLVKRIEELKRQIEQMEEQYQENEHYHENRMGEIRASAERIARNADWERQQAEDRLRTREYEAHDIARRIERARERGDLYECDKYLRRLKSF